MAGTLTKVFADEIMKIAEEESTARKVLHHPLAGLAAAIPPAVMLGWGAGRLHKHFASGGSWKNLPDVPLGVPAHLAVSLGPMLGLTAARALFPKQAIEKTSEYPRFRDPVNARTQPEVTRGLEPIHRLTPRPRPVTAFKLPPT